MELAKKWALSQAVYPALLGSVPNWMEAWWNLQAEMQKPLSLFPLSLIFLPQASSWERTVFPDLLRGASHADFCIPGIPLFSSWGLGPEFVFTIWGLIQLRAKKQNSTEVVPAQKDITFFFSSSWRTGKLYFRPLIWRPNLNYKILGMWSSKHSLCWVLNEIYAKPRLGTRHGILICKPHSLHTHSGWKQELQLRGSSINCKLIFRR